MPFDLKSRTTATQLYASKSIATNNTATTGMDIRGYESLTVFVNIGVKTVGDNDGAATVFLQSAANNTASEATNITGGTNVATTNNTAAIGSILVDPRACFRYIFGRIVLAGTNTPTYPITMDAIGVKQTQ